jgi:hypothetical protein
LPDLLSAAAAVAAGFDMMRVDLYRHAGQLWAGELTPYPGAGLGRLEPDLDALLGSWWTLPASRSARSPAARLRPVLPGVPGPLLRR